MPTAFFNWSRHRGFSLAEESSPAICFFNFPERRRQFTYELDQCNKYQPMRCQGEYYQVLGGTHALQSMAFSSALLISSFIVRTVKLFRFLSAFANNHLNKRIGSLRALASRINVVVQDSFIRIQGRSTNMGSRGNTPKPSVSQMLFSAVLVSFRMNLDLVDSVVAEVSIGCPVPHSLDFAHVCINPKVGASGILALRSPALGYHPTSEHSFDNQSCSSGCRKCVDLRTSSSCRPTGRANCNCFGNIRPNSRPPPRQRNSNELARREEPFCAQTFYR